MQNQDGDLTKREEEKGIMHYRQFHKHDYCVHNIC